MFFFSGKKAPNIPREPKNIHLLSDPEFIEELNKLGGTPAEFSYIEALLNHFLPVIRADFKIVETYNYIERPVKIDCDITIFNGKTDDITFSELIEWRGHAGQECKFYNFPGGHFFINDHREEIIKLINRTLLGE